MLWLILSLFAALAWSMSMFFDNYITDELYKGKTPQGMKGINGFYIILFAFIIFAITQPAMLPFWQIIIFLIAGAINSLAIIPYYLGLRSEESTSASVYFQLTPVIYLICGWAFFNEQISLQQIIGFLVIMAAPFVIIFSRKRVATRHLELKAASFFMFYVLLSAGSNIISTQLGGQVDHFAMIFWYLLGRGGMDLIVYFITPKWRQRTKNVLRLRRSKLLISCFIDQALSIAGDCMSRIALILGVAALSSVITNASMLIITFILGIILSAIWPKFGREKLHRHVIIAHLLAVALCVAGVIIIG